LEALLVERGEVGDGGQLVVEDPLEADAGEQDGVAGGEAEVGRLDVDGEDGKGDEGDEEDEEVGVEEVEAGLAGRVARGHDLGRLEQVLGRDDLRELKVLALTLLVVGRLADLHQLQQAPSTAQKEILIGLKVSFVLFVSFSTLKLSSRLFVYMYMCTCVILFRILNVNQNKIKNSI
jgi:hypothetical protein